MNEATLTPYPENINDLASTCRQMLVALQQLVALNELRLNDVDIQPPLLQHAISTAQLAISAGQSALNSHDLSRPCQQMRQALEQISNQAVCVNMDGDEGNERMLKYIMEVADNALAAT